MDKQTRYSPEVRERAIRFVLVALCTAVLGSSLPAQVSADSAPPLPSITLAAEVDRVLRDYEKAWGAGDAAALVALFTEDAFLLQPGQPAIRGRAQLEARYRGQGGGPLRLRPLSYSVDGNTGFIIGALGYCHPTSCRLTELRWTARGPRQDHADAQALVRRPVAHLLGHGQQQPALMASVAGSPTGHAGRIG